MFRKSTFKGLLLAVKLLDIPNKNKEVRLSDLQMLLMILWSVSVPRFSVNVSRQVLFHFYVIYIIWWLILLYVFISITQFQKKFYTLFLFQDNKYITCFFFLIKRMMGKNNLKFHKPMKILSKKFITRWKLYLFF